jgi:hypothetical protein
LSKILSKSRLVAFRQCPKRLWLEVHRPDLREDSAGVQTRLAVGNEVGEIARRLFDPMGKGELLDPYASGFDVAFKQTQQLLGTPQPIFEAGFQAGGVRAFADVMLPIKKRGQLVWRLVEVKSSTKVKDYHLDDAAIQVFAARAAGVPLASASIACIDSAWTYPGNDKYDGLLVEHEVSNEANERQRDVAAWLAGAQKVVAKRQEPKVAVGRHCSDPFDCGFSAYCQRLLPSPTHSIDQLPGSLRKPLQALVDEKGLNELSDVPDDLLNEKQRRVKAAALSGKVFFDRDGARQALAAFKLPAYFMDFETIQFAVPTWKSTRPYQQIPFQFSMHRLSRTGKLDHEAFLDLSGTDPSKAFAYALVEAAGKAGPIFSYNASFELSRILELASRFPRMAPALKALAARVQDLLPIAKSYYYHPAQRGSWSIKAVLPALCPDLDYGQLDGVQDGGMAMEAFSEALQPRTSEERKAEIHRQLTAYCALDTLALVRLWWAFSGSQVVIR